MLIDTSYINSCKQSVRTDRDSGAQRTSLYYAPGVRGIQAELLEAVWGGGRGREEEIIKIYKYYFLVSL